MSDEMRDVVSAIMRAAEVAQVSDAELAAYEARVARDQRRDRLRSTRVRSVLSADALRHVIDDTATSTPALRLVQHWLASAAQAHATGSAPKVRVLVLLGERGVGKTVAAAWALARQGGAYATSPELLASYATPYAPDRAPYLRARGAGLLVLDELPTTPTAEARAMLHDLIDHRQRGQLTLVIGNGSPSEWDALLDPRTRDRLGPMAFVRVLRGDSMRTPIERRATP
jgi:DNA replication protein DnaC